jgi:bifunctional polynucleotide phosphatase/kinase
MASLTNVITIVYSLVFLVKFIANYSTGQICVQQLGKSRSAVNNQSMLKGEKRLLRHGDKVALLYKSSHTYRFDFLTSSYGIDYNNNNSYCINKEIIPKIPLLNSTTAWDTRDGTLLVFNSTNIVHKDKVNINLFKSSIKFFI